MKTSEYFDEMKEKAYKLLAHITDLEDDLFENAFCEEEYSDEEINDRLTMYDLIKAEESVRRFIELCYSNRDYFKASGR